MRNIAAVTTVVVALAGGACSKKSDGKKDKTIAELKIKLQKAKERENTVRKELAQLTKRVTRLQNDFKIYSQKPCDYELDPIEYSIQKKGETRVASRNTAGTRGRPRRPARATRPKGPPAELKDVRTKARAARRGIKKCYQQALKKNASLQMGRRRVTLKFTVRPTGKMANIMVIPPIGSGFEPCVRSLLRKWHFSKFKGPSQRFRLPMTLRPQ
jgi:hypothetical protein